MYPTNKSDFEFFKIYYRYLNNMPINGGGRYFVLQNGNLIITNVLKSDEGNYTCEATNRVGRALGSTYLFVEDGTYIDQPVNPEIISNINQTFFLPCMAYKPQNIDLAYVWKFNGETLIMDGVHYAQDNLQRPGDLRIIRAQYTMEGQYVCIAKTTVDEVNSHFK